uniref:Uncharacterized protein LOC100179174 n=1 Tax=Phallusia mammillata TaxID=59560 RepID=A0A6F9DGF8_9ASCI|nr:uncharacterized protein LOC100179174 [Phallusia mammillata]
MDEPDSQFLPTSLTSMRRTSTGSLMRKRTSTSQSYEQASCSNYRDYASVRARKTPITVGGSWDDNSVGHGSVAARMRRERNKAIRRTQSTATYTNNPIDTHACVASTLNLINTTSLSPWKHHERLPWDEDYGLQCGSGTQSAAAKRSAGSLCNISSTMTSHTWDSRSIPDYSKMSGGHPTSFRHSFTSAHHHSSPTSGCASIASSDLDSADLAFFSMNDDSSLFDGDSLFSDTYGVMDADSGFSSNIFSLLEEGTISCRTPFLNGDWPDSISELDFDCSEQQNDISNCDAHSDIGPSCSVSTDRNKLKKRHIRSKSNALEYADKNNVERNGFELPTDPDIYLTNPRPSSRTNGIVAQQSHDDLMQQYVTSQQRHMRGKNPISAGLEHDGRANLKLNLSCEDMLLKSGIIDERLEEPKTPIVETEMAVAPSDIHMPPAVLEQQQQLERQLQQQQRVANDFSTPVVLNPKQDEIAPSVLPHLQPSAIQKLQQFGIPTVIQQQHIFQVPQNQQIVTDTQSVTQQPFLRHQTLQVQKTTAETPQAVQQFQQAQLQHPNPAETSTIFPSRPTLYQSTDQTRKFAMSNLDAPVQVQLRLNTANDTRSLPNSANASKAPIVLSINNWNGMPQEERLGFIEQLSERIKSTMGLQEKLEIINIIGAGNKEPINNAPMCMSIDDIDSHKLSRVFGFLDNQPTEDSPTKSETPPKPPETNLRRSNSDGNIPKTVTDAQKENRRRQRQARKWAKLMKQRQRKENRQLMKEHKSGLFVNEKKVKIVVESEEEVDLTDI